VTLDPFYSRSNMDALRGSIAQMQEGKTVMKTLDELEAMAHE
jgi:DNA-damage-inducible protein J